MLKLEAQSSGSAVVLKASGNLRAGESAPLQRMVAELVEPGVRIVVIDLSAVEEMDACGIGVLLGLRSRIERAGGNLTLVRPKTHVRRLLELCDLTDMFQVPALETADNQLDDRRTRRLINQTIYAS